ncbi:hypothetical protein GOODEAATRI_029444, partial [Goodea atripinnis]
NHTSTLGVSVRAAGSCRGRDSEVLSERLEMIGCWELMSSRALKEFYRTSMLVSDRKMKMVVVFWILLHGKISFLSLLSSSSLLSTLFQARVGSGGDAAK